MPCRTRGILDGFVYWFCLHIKWFVWLEISVQLNIRECFFRTLIARISLLQVCGTCFIKDKMLDNLYHSSRKRQRLQIRLQSFCIERKGQKKIRVKDSVCIGAIRELFFDLRSVAAGSQNELLQDLSLSIFIYCRKIILLSCALWACGYRAWIKKRSRSITDLSRSLYTDPFFWFKFWFSFDLDCTLTGQGGL